MVVRVVDLLCLLVTEQSVSVVNQTFSADLLSAGRSDLLSLQLEKQNGWMEGG